MTEELFISCAEHLESLLCEELSELRIPAVRKSFRGVFAEKSIESVYTINYLSRLATRVLWPLHSFFCPDRQTLYREAKKIPWLQFIDPEKTFAIDANVSHPTLRHSLFAAQCVKDALCDVVREKTQSRPSVDVKEPDVQFHLFIHNKRAVISLDTSGAPLYKRGWKAQSTLATIPETIAAALLKLSGYKPADQLCDPFCGSGTILIEAAFIATQTPAGFLRRKWGFFHLPQHDPQKWERFKHAFDAKRIPLEPAKICGADKDLTAINLCRAHLAKLGLEKDIPLSHKEVYAYVPPLAPTLIVTDPPLGKRLLSPPKIYEDFAHFLKRQGNALKTFVLAPDEERLSAASLSVVSRFPLNYGGLEMFLYEVLFS